jgi:GT2 family glycosyltransferase
MISVIFSTREDKPEHIEHLIKTSGLDKKLEVIQYINNGEYSLTELYNKGLKESKNNIVVFCHDDIIFDTKNWGTKLKRVMDKNPEYGIVGIAGSRELPSSAKWWENPLHMYGQVFHQQGSNRWISKYSPKKPKFLDNVVIVDGLFFAVNKEVIKEDFDEDVKGFHFYDVDFSFRNYIAGVKVGVTSDIDVTHLSIGETNEQWEKNREEFAEKYKDRLPVKAKKEFGKQNKMKVLIGCLLFNDYTGSELHVYELAKELTKQNCDVDIVSNIGPKMVNRIKRFGVNCYPIQEPPGYKLGDGKWGLNTPQGVVQSKPGQLYRVGDVKYDIIHINHKPIGEHLTKLYPNIPFINTIHSEVIPNLEEPVMDEKVKKYITIRESIADYVTEGWDIPKEKVSVIYNPIDSSRFKHYTNIHTKPVTLFVGTIDYLRKNTIYDLVEYTKENGKQLWLVGVDKSDYLNDLLKNEHVKHHPSTWDVERYVKECDETASILMGRTTIEGWLCGKPGWIYQIDKEGNITSKEKHEVPSDVDKFKSENVASEIIKEYESVI